GDGSCGGSTADRARIHPFRSPSSPAPLADDAKTPAKPSLLQGAPQLGALAAARRPLFVEPGKIGFERTAAKAEDIRPLTAKHLSHEPGAVVGPADARLDRRA